MELDDVRRGRSGPLLEKVGINYSTPSPQSVLGERYVDAFGATIEQKIEEKAEDERRAIFVGEWYGT